MKVSYLDLSATEKEIFASQASCGPRTGIIKKLLYKFYYGKLMNASCVQHDWNYRRGGGIKDKIKADVDMFIYSFCDAVNSRNIGLLTASFVYFFSVLFFGWPFFQWGPYRTKEKILYG